MYIYIYINEYIYIYLYVFIYDMYLYTFIRYIFMTLQPKAFLIFDVFDNAV